MNVADFKAVIEALQPLMADVTSSAIYIAAMYIGFTLLTQLFIPTSVIYACYKVCIMIKEYFMKEKTTVIKKTTNITLDEKLISTDGEVARLLNKAFDATRRRNEDGLYNRGGSTYVSDYIHVADAKWILDTLNAAIERQKQVEADFQAKRVREHNEARRRRAEAAIHQVSEQGTRRQQARDTLDKLDDLGRTE